MFFFSQPHYHVFIYWTKMAKTWLTFYTHSIAALSKTFSLFPFSFLTFPPTLISVSHHIWFMRFSEVARNCVIVLADLVERLGWTAGFAPGFCVLSRGRNTTESAKGELTQNNSSTQQGHIKLSVSERGGEREKWSWRSRGGKRRRRLSEACNRVER